MPKYDVAVLGGGPGGYVAAIRAGQLGLGCALIEEERIGGLCLNWGCIPSKSLLWSAELLDNLRRGEELGISFDGLRAEVAPAVERSRRVVDRMVSGVEFLLKKQRVSVIAGRGRLDGPGRVRIEPGGDVVEAENVIIATGGRFRSIPGVQPDGRTIITSREALDLRDLPETVVIIGGGAVGVEFAYFYRAYGAEVTIIELLEHLLPREDEAVARELEKSFARAGISVRTGAAVKGVAVDGERAVVAVASEAGEERFEADKVLVSVGVEGSFDGLGLEQLGVRTDEGFIAVDDRMRTNVPGVYAVGDVTGKLPLAHVASAQGVVAAEHIAGLDPLPLSYDNMPRCTYCQPQVASLGLTEAEARKKGIEVAVGVFPARGNGKAMAMGMTEGFAKIVVDSATGEVIGYHVIAHDATELMAEASLGSLLETTVRELGMAVHAHPTLSEMVKEAALAASGEAIHWAPVEARPAGRR